MAVIGHGAQFEINTTGSTFVTVNGVLDISFGSDKVDALDSTDMGVSGTVRTFIPGLENPGDVSVKLNLIPGDATQTDLYTAKGTVTNFKAILPGATHSYAFAGIITSLNPTVPDDKLAKLDCKIQITGPVTIV